MSKTMSKKNSVACLNNVNPWELAISDAQNKINQAQKQISALRRAIRAFQVMRDSGEPWPGSVEVSAGEPKTKTRRLRQE